MPSSIISTASLLPLELYFRIVALSDNASLAALAPVSRFLWSKACAKLWRELDDAKVMLDLLDRLTLKRPRKSHHDGPNGYTVKPFAHLGEPEKLQQFERWEAYAHFTHKITLNTATLTREKRLFLLKRAAEAPLVPHLRILLLTSETAYDGDPGYGYVRDNTPHAEHLTMLLISPDLHTLVMSFFHLEHIHFQTLVERLPNLTDLRIGRPVWDLDNPVPTFSPLSLDHFPGYPVPGEQPLGYFADPNPRNFGLWITGDMTFDPLASMARALATLPYLSELTIDGVSLERVLLGNLCQLPSLTSLTIVGPLLETDWGANAPLEATFPRLRDLILRKTRPAVAQELFRCEFLLRNIHCLRWDGGHLDTENDADGEAYSQALQLLASNAEQLHTLHLRCDYSPAPTSFWHESTALDPISAMKHLFELGVSSFTHEPECKHGLRSVVAGAPSYLRSLHIENVAVPVHTLPQLASAYPFLSHLRIELNARDWQSFSDPISAHAGVRVPVCLLLRFERTGWPKLGPAEEARIKRNLVRYLKTVWPAVSLYPNPVEGVRDWQIGLLGDLQHILDLEASAEGRVM